jgi:hypothetical protein
VAPHDALGHTGGAARVRDVQVVAGTPGEIASLRRADEHVVVRERPVDGVVAAAVVDDDDTYVGIEQLRIGSRLVPAYHYSVNRTLSGSQAGSEWYDIWYSVLDGLPVKTDRHLNVKSSSPIGAVTYIENGTYTLASLTPQW